jgi:hypothetical protein
MAQQDRARITKRFQEFVGQPDNYSSRVNSIIGRYMAIVLDAMPELSENEWLAICDANTGPAFVPMEMEPSVENDPARYAWMNVADSEPGYVKEAWGVDNLELARKMKSMSFIEQCGVVEVIQKFWEKSDATHENYRAMLEACGAKLST